LTGREFQPSEGGGGRLKKPKLKKNKREEIAQRQHRKGPTDKRGKRSNKQTFLNRVKGEEVDFQTGREASP